MERKRSRKIAGTYCLSIKLPVRLMDVIDREADMRLLTTASLIRETLADKFMPRKERLSYVRQA